MSGNTEQMDPVAATAVQLGALVRRISEPSARARLMAGAVRSIAKLAAAAAALHNSRGTPHSRL